MASGPEVLAYFWHYAVQCPLYVLLTIRNYEKDEFVVSLHRICYSPGLFMFHLNRYLYYIFWLNLTAGKWEYWHENTFALGVTTSKAGKQTHRIRSISYFYWRSHPYQKISTRIVLHQQSTNTTQEERVLSNR